MGKFDGSKNSPIQLGANMIVEGVCGAPSLIKQNGLLCTLFLIDPTREASRTCLRWTCNGVQDFLGLAMLSS